MSRSVLNNTFRTTSRLFSTSSTCRAVSGRDRNLGDWDMAKMDDFQFDDTTSFGHLRLQQIHEIRTLIEKVDADRAVLKVQAKPFRPPTSPIRLTSTIDLTDPSSPLHTKRVLVAPVSSLPLKSSASIHRFKLLAGPRWTPGRPGRYELEHEASGNSLDHDVKENVEDDGSQGWIKIAEERFPDARMNRKSVSDMLEKLVDAANDEKSPLSADIPLDPRHLLARQRKKRQRFAQHVWTRAEAIKHKPIVGGVRGFPEEWLKKPEI